MISFPNAKINLGLNVTGIRPDGYHDIETVIIPVGFRDILEIVPCSEGEAAFVQTGLKVPGMPGENLCLRAFQLLRKKIPGGIKMHLHKVIPMGSGLGGGSSDALSTLTILDAVFSLELNEQQLQEYAGKLGSDCTFFIRNQASFATGRGNKLKPVELNLGGYSIIIVVPPVHVSTAEAYKNVDVKKPFESIPAILKSSPDEWKGRLVNDFEESVFDLYPAIRETKEKLYAAGAVYASMSGSGSSVYGLFDQPPVDPGTFEGCTLWKGKLS